ncbi:MULTISPECIES: hypothetical protein [Rhodococcus]|uniref:Transcriptional regulator, AbiEi antitoxin, Type IV TA system n=1 Tax=Rhodococcoides kyotonense TaxID=398843 RepID=A0A177YFZ8_9NOCA|nr:MULTISPECIES: hypothetical protein [Rhodococcus]NIL76716.1 hypothetical protein [Rhodococcus sp. B10]OAK54474.1 hypothetical protein A3K89_03635 [Rhodococcus kyotonensis]
MYPEKDPLLLRRDMVRDGSSDSDIRIAKADGSITPLRRGAFVPTTTLKDLRPEERHLLNVRAHLAAATSALVVSHQSAAVVHGFAMFAPDLGKVHFTVDRESGGRTTKTRHVHANTLTEADVTVVDGIAVTSADRTVADLLRLLPFEAGVCVGDAALRAGSATVAGIEEALARSGKRAAVKARRTLAFCDARSESVGESRTRVLLHRAKMPPPLLQIEVRNKRGRFVGRLDLGYAIGVALEFDGKVKYTKHAKPGQDPGDVVFAEKVREDEIRRIGWVVLRVTWYDLDHPDEFLARLQEALDLAATLPGPASFDEPA